MKTAWTAGTKDAERNKEIRASFAAGLVLRKRLKELLMRKIEASLKARSLEEGYDSPNWALKQADASGYERAMREVLSLIEE